MALDSDTQNADALLHVEFFDFKGDDPIWKGKAFVRITIPGDRLTLIEQPLNEDHKRRFPRQYQYYLMQQEGGGEPIGTPLPKWLEDRPEEITDVQIAELQILKFRTVEQVAGASDAQLQKIGMGAAGIRMRAQSYLKGASFRVADEERDRMMRVQEEQSAQIARLMETVKSMTDARQREIQAAYAKPKGGAQNAQKVTEDV